MTRPGRTDLPDATPPVVRDRPTRAEDLLAALPGEAGDAARELLAELAVLRAGRASVDLLAARAQLDVLGEKVGPRYRRALVLVLADYDRLIKGATP